jgi:hypothetical protein
MGHSIRHMIGYLNPPFRDEILLSVLARYKKVFDISDEAVCTDFFGVRQFHRIVNFPSRLDYLERQIPGVFGITAAILIGTVRCCPFSLAASTGRCNTI